MRARSAPLLPLSFTLALASAGLVASTVAPRRAASQKTAPPRLPAEGPLSFDVRDADTGEPIPCKLTLVGVDGTPRPAFTHTDVGRQEGTAVLAYDRILSANGAGVVHVPAGTYDVFVSRGPEWDVWVARKVRIAAEGATVAARIKHVVDTSGWISADFHVHAAMSTDSHVPMEDRVYEFLADGVEIITSSDHNVVADYAPLITELGVGKEIGSLVGDEMTTGGWGHFGAFPLPQDLEAAGHGAVLVRGRTAAQFFADVRKNAPGAIIDVHHPRIDREIGYFNLSGFDPLHDRSDKPGFSFDFDAVEVLNGYQDSERRSVDKVVEDWFHLLDHGHLVTATGNSDTHHLDHNIGGYPRNYLRVLNDKPSAVKPEEIVRAIRAHNAFFTTAPFVSLRVNETEIGGTAAARGPTVKVEVEVRAPAWVSVSTVQLIHNGVEAKRWTVPAGPPGAGGERFRATFDLPVTRDGWLVAKVEGNEPLAPIVGDRIHFDVRPYALTNPVFLDHDGNDRYDPPMRCEGHEGPVQNLAAGTPTPQARHPRHTRH